MRRLIVIAIFTFSVFAAHADNYSYKCRLNGKQMVVKIDDVKRTIRWLGNVYIIKRELTADECAKFGWLAEKEGESLEFCTATQGVADLSQGKNNAECDLDR